MSDRACCVRSANSIGSAESSGACSTSAALLQPTNNSQLINERRPNEPRFDPRLASLVAMTLIDRVMGSRAECLNAWSVLERLVGRTPAVGDSTVATHLGPWGELVAVIGANTTIGVVLSALVTAWGRLIPWPPIGAPALPFVDNRVAGTSTGDVS